MPYTVNYSDSQNKTPITVFDNSNNTDTTLVFPGRNVTGYGQIIAENFLKLLENFASPVQPVNPIEGQLWFNSDPLIEQLLIYDGTNWKSSSGVQKSPVSPSVSQTKVGELWVDTVNQQLYVFSGTDWILVGPNFSSGLKSGLIVEQITDSTDVNRVILAVYVEDRPIIIISKDNFTPKIIIPQFPIIRAGINVADPDINISAETEIYLGGYLPKLYGTATSADGLQINNVTIDAGKFLRSDTVNTVEQIFNIRNDSGLFIGTDRTFNVSTSATAAKLYNNTIGSAIDFQSNLGSTARTILRIINGKVGINTLAPSESLEVTGNTVINGQLIIKDTSVSTNTNNGSVLIAGGIAIEKNIIINDTLQVYGDSVTASIIPSANDFHELGSVNRRWNAVRTKTLFADSIVGVLQGSISGNAGTSTSLQQATTFSITGDVSAPSFTFNGVTGGFNKTFNTTISPEFIVSKVAVESLTAPNKDYSLSSDQILLFRDSISGLLRTSRDTFVGDLGLPIAAIIPYAGNNPPDGFLFCDGTEVLISKYESLYNVIGNTYNGPSPLLGTPGTTFRIPDLRGRFPLGRENMDNGEQVSNFFGVAVDGGGGTPVPGSNRINSGAIGSVGGASQYTLSISNLPNHQHNMKGSTGAQYYASRSSTAVPLDTNAFLGTGGNSPNQTQYLPNSGGIDGVTGQPYGVVNPFATINYIIRSGRSAF